MPIIKDINTPDWSAMTEGRIVLVDFWAPWCQACKVQENILVEVLSKINSNVLILKMNIDDNRWLSQKLGVRNIPMMVLYDNSNEIKRFDGLQVKGVLIKELSKY